MSQDDGSSESDDEYQKTLQKLQKARNQQEGKKGEEGEKNEEAEEEEAEDDEDDDSDYEYAGGDLALYDSALDDTDEITFIRDAMQQITQVDMNYYMSLTSLLTEEERNQFNDVMNGA